jgi:beta-galactosidase
MIQPVGVPRPGCGPHNDERLEERMVQQAKLAAALLMVWGMLAMPAAGQQAFTEPKTAHVTYNFNPGWKFIKEDVQGSEAAAFNDSAWADVSTPHTYNDTDTFDGLITRGGEVQQYMGPARYRKHFTLPESARGNRIVIEFEGMRQSGKFWVNGKPMGQHEDGVTACGIDITDAVNFGGQENVLAVWVTNANDYKEEATGQAYQWMSKDFNPSYGGINRNVRLHVLPPIHQTLPLLNNLKTTGVYVYAADHDLAAKKATLNIEAQVKNASTGQAAVTLSAFVVDRAGNLAGKIEGETYDMVNGETTIMKASGPLTNVRWWDPADPYLYDVYTVLSVGDRPVDVQKNTTGFRKTEFKGGAGAGGVYINGKFVYLKGYAQRTTNEWATIGAAYPNWMHDFDFKLMTDGNANYMRWMHIAPRRQEVVAADKWGIVEVCPAGDKEANPTVARQWEQRKEVMRATIVYYRNSPSILFWEAGNNGIPADRMQQMVDIRKELDPNGGRAMGCRSLPATQGNQVNNPADRDPGAVAGGKDENLHVAEYFGVMVGQDRRTDELASDKAMFRAFSRERRDAAPIIETEDFRDESLRRYWDKFSPPHFGFKKGPSDTYDLDSEQFCLAGAARYNDFWSRRISNTDPKKSNWSGYASIIWADSNQHGRMPDSATARVSGKVDSVRIPKQLYYVERVMQNEKPDSHIIGHWNYPEGTKKPMYVAASNVDSVELFVNSASKGKVSEPRDGFIYAFPDIAWQAGTIKAVGYKGTQAVTQHELKTVGEPRSLKLTPHTGPKGLLADGADIAFFDVEVVDGEGHRCPLDESRVDFELSGPATWRGGVNVFKPNSTNNTYLSTECGINRVFIRSTLKPGAITLTAKREGLPAATVQLEAKPFEVRGGLTTELPQELEGRAKP